MYRILYVNHVGQISGAERVLQNLLNNLDRTKFEPCVAAPQEGRLLEELRKIGIPVYPIETPLLFRSNNPFKLMKYIPQFWKITKRLKTIVQQEKIDLIHANSFSAHLYSILAAKITHRPLIWHMHDFVSPRWFNRWCIWFAGKMANQVICNSDAVRSVMVALGVPSGICKTVYNGMNCERNLPSPAEQEQIRKELKIPDNTLVISMVGAITHWKGQHIFIQAAAQIVKLFPEVRFLIVGDIILDSDQEYKLHLQKLVSQLGIQSQVIFTGFRNDISLIMASSDIMVHSSVKPEPYGMVIVEAMALKKPVIAARAGGVIEIVIDGVTGLLVTPEKSSELATAMQTLITSPELRQKMGDAGRKQVEQSFNIRQNIAAIQDIYTHLLLPDKP